MFTKLFYQYGQDVGALQWPLAIILPKIITYQVACTNSPRLQCRDWEHDDQVAGLPYQLLLLRHDEDKSGVKVGHSEDREHRLGTVGLFLNKENVHPKGQTSLV